MCSNKSLHGYSTAEHGWSIAKWLHKQKAVLASADAAVIVIHKSSNTPNNKPNKQAGNHYIAFVVLESVLVSRSVNTNTPSGYWSCADLPVQTQIAFQCFCHAFATSICTSTHFCYV